MINFSYISACASFTFKETGNDDEVQSWQKYVAFRFFLLSCVSRKKHFLIKLDLSLRYIYQKKIIAVNFEPKIQK